MVGLAEPRPTLRLAASLLCFLGDRKICTCRREWHRSPWSQAGDKLRNRAAVGFVVGAEVADQVALFEVRCDYHVGGECGGEESVAEGHRRNCPESDCPADVQRMADVAVE